MKKSFKKIIQRMWTYIKWIGAHGVNNCVKIVMWRLNNHMKEKVPKFTQNWSKNKNATQSFSWHACKDLVIGICSLSYFEWTKSSMWNNYLEVEVSSTLLVHFV
jgi:hypothetical protein